MGRKTAKTSQTRARQRAPLIIKVRCGLISASQAAAELGVSRKTYYKWEQRGLAGLLDGLSEKDPGRRQKPDDTAEKILEKQLADLRQENRLLEQKVILKDLAWAIEHSQGELKGWLAKWKAAAKTIRELALAVENAANATNHRSRRCLSGKNACRSYFASSRLRCNKRKRKTGL